MEINTKEMKLNDEELKNVAGGEIKPPNVRYCGKITIYPSDELLHFLELDNIVVCNGGGWKDNYFDTKRSNGWKQVGISDMINYVARTVGYNDPRYLALCDYCEHGNCTYKNIYYSWQDGAYYD